MSRSRRQTPVFGMTTARTEKEDKRKANRKLRRLTRQSPEDAPPHVRAVADVWSFAKDGKVYLPATSPFFRRHGKEMMRK